MSEQRDPPEGAKTPRSGPTRVPRRRLLQALGGAAGLATIGLPGGGPVNRVRTQASESGPWTQQAKLTANDGDPTDLFAVVSVSGDGTTAVIGADSAEGANGEETGAAYVFELSGREGPPPLGSNEAPPQDLDGDGRYEDTNGDGQVNILDVVALYSNLESDAVQNNPEAFDFNGDGQVNILDVVALSTNI